METERIDEYDLKEIISILVEAFQTVNSIYLFGSRAYKTSSLRSDIDLLIISDEPIPAIKLYEWITTHYPVVDIFKSTDNLIGESSANGSVINSKTNLVKDLNAIEIWNRDDTFNTKFVDWIQEIRSGVIIAPTYAKIPYNLNEAIKDFNKFLFENNLPNTNLGSDWKLIGDELSNKVQTTIEFLEKWNGTSGTFNKIQLTNEKDFQNLCELILKPWLPTTQRETTVAIFDGQNKNIDFSINLNSILIEAKHIKDANTESKAIKEIEGITKFYLSNTNVKLLLFWVLIEKDYEFDRALLESTFNTSNENTLVITRIYNNQLNNMTEA